jgi:hypothetical protein
MPGKIYSIHNIVLAITILLACVSCEQPDDKTNQTYSLFIMTEDANEYVLQTNLLNEGILDPEKNGILLNTQNIGRDLIVKNGFYYYLNKKDGVFYKYTRNKNTLQKVDSVVISDFYENNYSWLENDTLLLLGSDREDSIVKYVKIATADFSLTQGIIAIEKSLPAYNALSIGFSNVKDDKLFIGYTFHIYNSDSYSTSDTAFIAILNYKNMQVLETIKDTRSTFPGSHNLIEPATFKNETGDFYFLTCPGVALGNNIEKPTAILRILNNADRPDSTYFFNISASPINNHAYSIYYIGKNKAIIRSERKDLYKNWNEHWKVPHYEFYVLDLTTQTIDKLKLPLDKGTRRQCVLAEGNLVYISINSDTEGNNIWIYNTLDGSLKKGLALTGHTSFILRMDKLN